ncbi:MAG: transporter substrate-binding domain-containing protein [Alphaproteobacteria bacterium]|nr:transporter substrate-binding domain-containing protein [Alphaproteobacteria bacterium]
MNKYITGIVSAAGLTALVCGGALAGEDLDRIMDDGVFKVATDANWAPQSFLNEDNEMDGFDVDVAKEIAKRLGVEVEFVTPDWSVITAGSWNDRWDASVGSMTPTQDRAKVLEFPAIYYYTPASFAVHADSPIQDKSELNGQKIGACTACTFELYLQGDLTIDAEGAPPHVYDVKPGEIHSLKDSSAIMDDLRLGHGVRIHGMIDSLPAILEAIKNGYPLRIVGTPAFYEPLAVAIDKGDPELRDKIAVIVKEMHDDGTLSAFSVKWYGEDFSKTEPAS